MPKVHTVQKARKADPAHGIEVGDTYYWWKTRMTVGKSYVSRIHKSKKRPRPSQLTSSEFLSQAYAINERIEDFDDRNGIADFIEEIKGEAENLRDEEQGKLDNLPEQLQEGPTGETLQERIGALDDFITELESLEVPDDEEPEEPEPDDFEGGEDGEEFQQAHDDWAVEHDEWNDKMDTALEELKNLSIGV